ncbi:MAG: VWA domain-containing protein, partial [Candidatus Omnitrophica bacterium]|nr:VWA domain-containing protein [Candidatus Omnitrophota bacterium]
MVRRLLTLARKIFRKTIYEESSAALTMVIIVDVSGSVTGNNQLVKFFTNMAKYFVSLLYLSGRNNPNVHSALYAIGETFHRVYSLDECRDEERLRVSPQELWEKKDYGGINSLAVLNGLRKVFLQSPDGAPKVYFVHTDGQETSGQSFSALREMAVALEEELGAAGVFVGVGTDEVKNYHRYILLSSEPNDEMMMRIIMKVGMHLVDHGSLPRGNLIKELRIEEDTGARADGGSQWNLSPADIETIERQNRREYAKAAFRSLNGAGVITADNREQVRALLLAIAERAEIFTEVAYEVLDPLAKNLQEKDFAGLLNPDLLSEAITGYLALQGLEVGKFIDLLTEFVTREEGLIRANFQKRLEQYVYRMAFYKQVYGRLPGNYGELNKNTYIGVIEEQRFDVLMKYVARLAAAVRGKLEEDGKEALRETISAIREEAEHSPTVEALFNSDDYDGKRLAGNDLTGVNFTHDKNDGGTRETVSREELNGVLQEILKDIDPNHREYAQLAFRSLSEAGVITAGNLEQVRALLLAIAKGSGEYAVEAYNALDVLAKGEEMSPAVLDLELLLAIAEGAGIFAVEAYNALDVLAKGEELSPVVLDLKLLLAIAKGSGEYAWRAYKALGAIAEAVEKKELSPAVLDLKLLLAIAEGAGTFAVVAYDALGALAKAVKIKEMSPVVLDLDLLFAIAEGAGEFTGAAYKALGAIAEAGAITAGNLEQASALLLAIAKGAGKDTWVAYYALYAIARAVKAKEMSPVVLDLDLLLAIAKGAGKSAWLAYQALDVFAKAVKEEELSSVVLDLKLLLAIAKGAGKSAGEAYQALGAIVEAVKVKDLNPAVLDLELLLAIAKGAGKSAWKAYNALGTIAKAVKVKKLSPVVLDLKLLLAIAKGAGQSTGEAYLALGAIAEAGVITAGNLKQVRALLLAIAEGAGGSAWEAYEALGAIAEAVKVKELNPVVLDLELLLAIAERAEIFTEVAYKALDPLAKNLQEKDFAGLLNPDLLSEAITDYLKLEGLEVNEFIQLLAEFVISEEGLIRANFQKRLEQYVYRM